MTDLRDQLARLLDGEPEAPYDIDRIVSAGRRARRRRNAVVATASTVGAAGLTAAVVIPVLASGGNEATLQPGTQPSPKPTPTAASTAQPSCFVRITGGVAHRAALKRQIARCVGGQEPQNPVDATASPQAGAPYTYTEDPAAISSRLGAHLHDRVTGFGLSISYTRPFAQESSSLDSGHPAYFGGNVDVHESPGYGDIGVQVRHETTELVPFDGDCTGHCVETKLPDGSVLRTDQVKAGRGDTVLTAEVHRPDGVIVQAQESNYPFGPDAGSQAHGDQPLSLDQLVSLAEDKDFSF